MYTCVYIKVLYILGYTVNIQVVLQANSGLKPPKSVFCIFCQEVADQVGSGCHYDLGHHYNVNITIYPQSRTKTHIIVSTIFLHYIELRKNYILVW